jgi:hypothetical protein
MGHKASHGARTRGAAASRLRRHDRCALIEAMASPPPGQSMLADRRWLVGIAISLVFGTFGSVMAWLSYAGRSRAVPAAAAATAPPSPASEAPESRGRGNKRHGRD